MEGQVEVNGEDYNVEEIGERAPFKAVLDVGLARTTTGAKIFAVMKGVADGGIDVPHSETRFFGYDSEGKSYDAESHRARIFGQHVADYMRSLAEDDEDAYKRQFGRFIKLGITADGVEEMYKKGHAAIRANPELAKIVKRKTSSQMRFTAKRISYEERKQKVVDKKELLLTIKEQMMEAAE